MTSGDAATAAAPSAELVKKRLEMPIGVSSACSLPLVLLPGRAAGKLDGAEPLP